MDMIIVLCFSFFFLSLQLVEMDAHIGMYTSPSGIPEPLRGLSRKKSTIFEASYMLVTSAKILGKTSQDQQ